MKRQSLPSALLLLALVAPVPAAGQSAPSPEDIASRILRKGLEELGAFRTLAKIVSVGPRLTGSPQAEAAVKLMVEHMGELGFENVRTEPTTVGRWERGVREEARVLSSRSEPIDVAVRALGGSIATPEEGLTAEVVEFGSFEELRRAGERARGKIIFFNKPMNPAYIDTFRAYGEAAGMRANGGIEAAKAGGIAVIVRSLTLEIDDQPHTGLMEYRAGVPEIPGAALSTKDADRLSAILKADPRARFFLKTSCRRLPDVVSHNVMGELRGTEKPDEIVLLGGHLDSWDLSEGAHDDGAGCAQSIEALRLIRELGLKPKRTIRAVLFMDEENGGTGGRDYARHANRAAEKHLAAVESDRGGFRPLGIGAGSPGPAFDKVKSWEPLFLSVGLFWVRPGGGGVDTAPLQKSGTVTMGLVPDSQRYFDVHHSPHDTLGSVHPRELELGATALALLAWLIAQEGL